VPDELIAAVHERVRQPYTSQEHQEQAWVVRELASGRSVDATAIAVLNALWEAVPRGKPYVNEIAVAESLAVISLGASKGRAAT
jgi:hypothetical protein